MKLCELVIPHGARRKIDTLFNKFHFLGPPLVVEINMQVRSMGPISEVDMVRF